MKFIKTMEQFLFEQKQQEVKSKISKLFSNILLEQEVSFSSGLVDLFHEIGNKNQISQFILNHLQNNKIDLDTDLKNVEYVDLHPEKQDTFLITYTKSDGSKVTQEKKVGKFTNSLLKALKTAPEVTSTDIESFVKEVFAERTGVDITYTFKLVSGKDIQKYYLEDNSECLSGGLGGSCMRHERTQPFINFYVQNSPEKVNLLIKLNPKTDKIVGRALVWNLDSGKKYLDRIYTTDNKYIQEFINYATKNLNIKLFFDEIGLSAYETVTIPKFFENTPKYMPYMDTFKIGAKEEDDLILNDFDSLGGGYLEFNQTDGSYKERGELSEIRIRFLNEVRDHLKTDENGSVYYEGDIDLSANVYQNNQNGIEDFTFLDILNIKTVRGNFYCGANIDLESLHGCPPHITGNFDCSGCPNIRDMSGSPKIVEGDFSCTNCGLDEWNASLEFVGGTLDCSGNENLESLDGFTNAERIVYNDTRVTNDALFMNDSMYIDNGDGTWDYNSNLSFENISGEINFKKKINKLRGNLTIEDCEDEIWFGENFPDIVEGDFDVSDCPKLTSLRNSPSKVGSLALIDVGVETLKYCPKEIEGEIYISFCKKLISLEGLPLIANKEFTVANNPNLETLKGCPEEVTGNCNFPNNKITSLEGAPEIIRGVIGIHYNEYLKSLKGFPKVLESGKVFAIELNASMLPELKKIKRKYGYTIWVKRNKTL